MLEYICKVAFKLRKAAERLCALIVTLIPLVSIAADIAPEVGYRYGATIYQSAIQAEYGFYSHWRAKYYSLVSGCSFNRLTWEEKGTELHGYIPQECGGPCHCGHSLPVRIGKVFVCPDGYTTSTANDSSTVCVKPDNELDPLKTAGPPKTCEGNPCDAATGNKYQVELDYQSLVSAFPIKLERNYNSYAVAQSTWGARWRSNYDRSILLHASGSLNTASLRRSDGKVYRFNQVNEDWIPEADVVGSIVQLKTNGVLTGWQFQNKENVTETYNAEGRLISLENSQGIKQDISYSCGPDISSTCPTPTPDTVAYKAGLPIEIKDSLGNSLQLFYDATSRVVKVKTSDGGMYVYEYDDESPSANLISVIYPNQVKRTYLYNEVDFTGGNDIPNALTGIIDENDERYATWTYDSQGRVTSSEHGDGVDKVNLTYFSDGSTKVIDAFSSSRTYQFQTTLGVTLNNGFSREVTDMPITNNGRTYDANGNIATKTDFNGNQTTYAYDMSRNLETSRTEGLTAAGTPTAATRTITTSWHPTWRLPLVVSEYSGASASGTPLRTTTADYDDKGNITSVNVADPVNNKTRTMTTNYTYSQEVPGLILTKVVDGPRTDVNDITTYQYYPHDVTCTPSSATPIVDPVTDTSPENLGCRGQLQSISNALNQTTTYDRYNHHGQVEQMTDPNGLVTENTYDLRQRITSRTVGTELTSLQYDAVGQLTQLTLPDGSQLTYTYDAAHRLTDITDNQGNSMHYTLDSMGNRINEETKDPQGTLTKTLSRSYDALNRLQQVTGIE